MSSKNHALYLTNPDTGHVELIHGDDVEAKLAAGYKHPQGQKANGAAWNTEADQAQQDAAAEFAKDRAEHDAKEAAAEAKAAAKADDAKAKAKK